MGIEGIDDVTERPDGEAERQRQKEERQRLDHEERLRRERDFEERMRHPVRPVEELTSLQKE